MKVYEGLAAATGNIPASVVAVGTLDGVHLGHRSLIAQALEEASGTGAVAMAITWDRHPIETLRPDQAPLLLTTLTRKLELLEAAGVEATLVLPFDAELSSWSPERFVGSVLRDGVHTRAVVVGSDWRFGHRAAGDVPLLIELGRQEGFEVDGVKLLEVAGGPVSSSPR